jgi:hypothetical protein
VGQTDALAATPQKRYPTRRQANVAVMLCDDVMDISPNSIFAVVWIMRRSNIFLSAAHAVI